MAVVGKLGRLLGLALGVGLLAVGGVALASALAPELGPAMASRDLLLGLAVRVPGAPGGATIDAALSNALVQYGLAPLGLLLLVGVLLPGKARIPKEDDAGAEAPREEYVVPVDKKTQKKAHKQAAALARSGRAREAADLCFEHGLMEEAAKYFIKAEEFIRAAEIRHDQNRFIESAELYMRAGSHDSAGSIFAQQEEWGRAAEAYCESGNLSVAAEMFEKAEDWRSAAECYEKSDFPRYAAKAYVKCGQWKRAATCLESVIGDNLSGGSHDAKRQAETQKLVLMAGDLYVRAGEDVSARKILEKGECWGPAAEIALRTGAEARAAELFLKAHDAPRASKVLKALGRDEDALRILAEHHRDRGEEEEAARNFEAAGELMAAGDLYRVLEQYENAGRCYEKQGEFAQAAEMYSTADLRELAAEAYEKAGSFKEAAACWALEGDIAREAELLGKAGEFLRAGELHVKNGDEDEAIKLLQQVGSDHPEFAAASAILGEIFRQRDQISLALKKLTHATAGAEIARENIGAFHGLATVHEASENYREALDIFEKILAFDYHYGDGEVERRVEACKAKLESKEEARKSETSPLSRTAKKGRYEITGKLGRGGMGIVYKAQDTVLDRTVAFKVLPDTLHENPQALKNFLREAKSAAQLNHPNIVTVYDAGEQDGVYYIAMEYVDGNTLKEIVKARGRISAGGIVHVLAQMCEALAYAHENKIVHRDVKTANTMWTRDRKAKIMDFGLARVIEEVRNHTTVISGTPYYMSPEQTLGKNVDHRTDIYSLGVTVFELATGTLPFREGNLPYHHVHTPPPDPVSINPEVPPLIARVIARCLQKDPADRYSSTREILEELKASLKT
ncbi:MAG: protein kinase domain-containing protein [Myxococcota bacterium]